MVPSLVGGKKRQYGVPLGVIEVGMVVDSSRCSYNIYNNYRSRSSYSYSSHRSYSRAVSMQSYILQEMYRGGYIQYIAIVRLQ